MTVADSFCEIKEEQRPKFRNSEWNKKKIGW